MADPRKAKRKTKRPGKINDPKRTKRPAGRRVRTPTVGGLVVGSLMTLAVLGAVRKMG